MVETMIVATKLRERKPDNYDPHPRFKWIVELSALELGDGPTLREWLNLHATGEARIEGYRVGFVNRDDAVLFLLSHC